MGARQGPSEQGWLRRRARVIQALAHPTRLHIAELLRGGAVCVCELAARTSVERPNLSRHLAVMRAAGVVQFRREGTKALYSLRAPCVLGILDCSERVLGELEQQRRRAAPSFREEYPA